MQNAKAKMTNQLAFIKNAAPLVNFGSLEVPANQTYFLTSQNSHFPRLTLNSGSIFEIANGRAPEVAFRLEIDELVLKPNGPAALMRFFNPSSVNLDGENGSRGARGNDGVRTGKKYVQATPGQNGEDGEHGDTVLSRGKLFLSIQRITIIPNVPLTRGVFSFDADGLDGGDGGDGGNGGNGGNGALGQSGKHKCDWSGCRCKRGIFSGSAGANGGNGGYPGNGGNGGNGATITFEGPQSVYDSLLAVLDFAGGQGGVGGTGGAGGSGGNGAPSYHGGGGHCGRRHPAKPAGSPGEFRNLIRGTNGTQGAVGSITAVNALPAFETIVDSLMDDFDAGKIQFD